MKPLRIALALAIAATTATGPALADGHIDAAIKARQGQMKLYSHYIGLLGGMAKGDIDYDADAASKAAASIAALSGLDASRFWPEGSDNVNAKDTRALPDIWAKGDDVITKAVALNEAAVALSGVAGSGLEPMQGAIGALGKACGDCHKAYRQPEDK